MPVIVSGGNNNGNKGSVSAALGVMLAPLFGGWFLAGEASSIIASVYGYLGRSIIRKQIGAFIGVVFVEAVKSGIEAGWESDFLREKIILEIANHTGLELETLDADGMKKAAGALMARKFNDQYGTNFQNFYPPSELLDSIKTQLTTEIIDGLK